jgi:membrane-bound serine protease (ClpP class)
MNETLMLAYGLIAGGLLLMLAELVFPSGLLFALALAGIVVGVVLSFTAGPVVGLITLVCVGVGLPALLATLLHYWPRTTVGRRFFLSGPKSDATLASLPGNLELEQLRGRYGRTLSALRPAGVTDFDGRRVDTITEGMMVDPGQLVRCIDVQAGKVVVRPVDARDYGILEKMEFE